MTRLLRSRWVAPMDGRVIEDGAVAFGDGRIAGVGRFADLGGEFSSSEIEDLGDAVLLPGLVNAHVHLELSDCTPGEAPRDGLEGWLTRMLSRTAIEPEELARRSVAAAMAGAAECVKFGVSSVGDISRQCHATRGVLREGPLRVVSFGEVMAMARRRGMLEERLEQAADAGEASSRLRIGITPHSPYSVEIEGYRRCVELARRRGLPIATHLAETRSEWAFLAEQTGPLKALWDAWLTWDDLVPRYAHGPICMARDVGLLDVGAVLAHVNYCSDAELDILARGKASVVYCPRTHAYFGHPPHRFREMMDRGINVAAGTDSRASSPDLNLVEELRLIHQIAPEMEAEAVWRMGTLAGAVALGMEGEVGQLAPGSRADLVAFAAGRNPLVSVLESSVPAMGVWIDGVGMHEAGR